MSEKAANIQRNTLTDRASESPENCCLRTLLKTLQKDQAPLSKMQKHERWLKINAQCRFISDNGSVLDIFLLLGDRSVVICNILAVRMEEAILGWPLREGNRSH